MVTRPRIDGEYVKLGDSVFDIQKGNGVVDGVYSDGRFSVRHGGGSIYYNDGGTIGNTRQRLFWHDPIQVHPPKSARFWRIYNMAAASLYKSMAELVRMNPEALTDDEA